MWWLLFFSKPGLWGTRASLVTACGLSIAWVYILETGRTHQIRVHMASIGHPILGDPVYGGNGSKFAQSNKILLDGQCLHAKVLGVVHPRSGEYMEFEAPLPPHFERTLEVLRKNYL